MEFDDRPDAAKRLESARLRAGFETAAAAAKRHGWSYATYSQHERGERGLSRAAAMYAKAFRVSQAWLLTGEGSHPKSQKDQLIEDLETLSAPHRAAVAALVRSLKSAEDAEDNRPASPQSLDLQD